MVLLIDTIPGLDFGVYIILFTIIVKFLLLPLAIKAIKAQHALKLIEPKARELQKQHKDDKQMLGIKTMEMYRENKVNPFASFGLILIQIPIIFGLYHIVFLAGLPEIDPVKLYSFISTPLTNPSPLLFNILDVTTRSLPLALIAGITQYIQIKIAMPAINSDDPDATPQQKMMVVVTKQLQYIFPVLITITAYLFSAAVAIYFITSNIFHILQELYVRSRGIKDQSSVAFNI